MRLTVKFNLVFVTVFLLGMLVAGGLTYRLLQKNARNEVLQNARIIMEAALAQRQYTVEQVTPLLQVQLRYTFLPQSVSAYAATETFNIVHKEYPDFSYKEAALNPTNPRDRAVAWEEDILRQFRDGLAKDEIIGERETPTGGSLFLARPIQIKNPACLKCHTLPSDAPETMIAQYGPSNGFGWKLNEIVAAQIVSVPTAVARTQAMHAFQVFMLSLAGVFLFIFIALNLMLRFIVIRPVTKLAALADRVSLGEVDLPEFETSGRDEIGKLAASFGRMRKSLERAMKMLEE